jgi:hypothetical protein
MRSAKPIVAAQDGVILDMDSSESPTFGQQEAGQTHEISHSRRRSSEGQDTHRNG